MLLTRPTSHRTQLNGQVIEIKVISTFFPIDKHISTSQNVFSVTIVVVSRLVYRKGVDLMAGVISKLANVKNVNFLVAGDGPKRTLLEEIREQKNLQDRVELLGPMEHSRVRDVLRRGHIFLNTSLTEAYCMAIVEAASCGLQVVSTRVGGIPEVLPSNLIILTEANVDALLEGVLKAMTNLTAQRTRNCNGFNSIKTNSAELMQSTKTKPSKRVLCPYECNNILGKLYNWNDVTTRTEKVYNRVMHERDPPFGDKLNRYLVACMPFVLVVSFSYLLLRFLDVIEPRRYIDLAKDWNKPKNKSKSQ